MEHPGRLLDKRVLIGAKVGESVIAEPIKLPLGLFPTDRKPKLAQVTRVIRKLILNERDDLLGD